jgi:transcriptional regulator with XRE-family HTH domain
MSQNPQRVNNATNITGQRIRELRKKHNMLQSQVGEYVGVGKSAIAGYESGFRNPKKDTISLLAELFNTSTDYLLGHTDNPEPPKPEEPKDLAELIKNNDFHYNGKKLDDKDLDLVIQILERIAGDK